MSGASHLRVGISGHAGFIGRHLEARLRREPDVEVIPLSREALASPDRLGRAIDGLDALVHLAGLNRGEETTIFDTNVALVERLASALRNAGTEPHVVFASSTQRELDTSYGRSKREGERLLKAWAGEVGAPLSILVIPNVFGPGCRPFYNSVVATFAHQVAHDQKPEIHVDRELELVYVVDLAETILGVLRDPPQGLATPPVGPVYRRSVSRLRRDFEGFADAYFRRRTVPDIGSALAQRLYSTFLSHVDYERYRFAPRVHRDPRGYLVECVRDSAGGQTFFSVSRPGIVRGNHYHTRKVEKFCVLEGEAVIRMRRLGTSEIVEYRLNGDRPEVVDIPVLHAHHIENVGRGDLLTLFWCNEVFDPEDADTHPEPV